MYICRSCSSPEVEYLTWVDLNSGEDTGDSTGEYYCRSCGNSTEVEFKQENDEESN